jgi:hypothetical protein
VKENTVRSHIASGGARRKSRNGKAAPPEYEGPPREAPRSVETEQAFLGAALLDNVVVKSERGRLRAGQFFVPAHRQIFDAIEKKIAAGQPADQNTLRSHFENGELVDGERTAAQYIGWLLEIARGTRYAREYAQTIRELADRRETIRICEEISAAAYAGPVDFSVREQIAEARKRFDALANDGASVEGGALEFARDATIELVRRDIVKNLLSASSTAMLYGPSRAGKTFCALEMLFCIALGKEFMGRATEQGAVMFVPLEGQGNFRKRLVAARMRHGDPGKHFAWLTRAGTLNSSPQSAAYVDFIIAACKQLAREAGGPVKVVAIDTLARALAGENENDAAVMAAAVGHAASPPFSHGVAHRGAESATSGSATSTSR